VAEALKVGAGKQVEIAIENGALVLRLIGRPERKPAYALEELHRTAPVLSALNGADVKDVDIQAPSAKSSMYS